MPAPYTKEDIKNLAIKGIIKVRFQKTDGTIRNMRCTLNPKYLPVQTDLEEHTTKENSTILAVWDLDKEGWRSFRINSVLKVDS